MSLDWTANWTHSERLAAIVAQQINDAPAEELIRAATDDVLRAWATRMRTVGNAKGWSTWGADYLDPDTEFTDVGMPPLEELEGLVAAGAEKDTSGGSQPAEGESTPVPELLQHAASFEIPRAEAHRLPLLLQRIHRLDDAWVILNRAGQCWARDNGGQWVAYFGGLGWLQQRPSVRFPLTEAWTLGRRIAATELPGRCRRNVVDGDFGNHIFKKGALADDPAACVYCGRRKPEETAVLGAEQGGDR